MRVPPRTFIVLVIVVVIVVVVAVFVVAVVILHAHRDIAEHTHMPDLSCVGSVKSPITTLARSVM